MKQVLLTAFLIGSFQSLFAQSIWTPVSNSAIQHTGERKLIPDKYTTFQLDTTVMRAVLAEAPSEQNTHPGESTQAIEVPTPDGQMLTFRIVRYEMMEPTLSTRYPEIITLLGVSADRSMYRIRLDWTARGFHAVFDSPKGKVYIDPYAFGDTKHYVCYYKRNYPTPSDPFICHVDKTMRPEEFQADDSKAGDCIFRSYRLAMATTGEYSNYHGATSAAQSALVLAAVVTAVNRVNEVYEADLSIRLILIGNTDDVFYYNPATDPFTNNNGSTMLGENQTNMTNVIGSANYDIGHVFSTGGGGVANLFGPCNASLKARGVTGLANPIGDPFYIDYVAHEMGHQFGANHTQNNNCNRNGATAMEPGSASTIMGYAGVCAPNIQAHSDAYMHGISVQEIGNFVAFGSGNNCDTPVAFTNNAPVVNAGADHVIPVSTPFVLTAGAIDINGDPITYCWEQWDNEVGPVMPPAATNSQGPMFRSLLPASSPTRYFPNLTDLVNNATPTWEVLPSVGRSMEFRVTARDFTGVAGCTDEDNVMLTVSGSAGPFLVTQPNTGAEVWNMGQSVLVTWDVANTDMAPVSCANVDLLISYDGGFTYPDVLASGVTNNGSHFVTVPNNLTNTARVMVRCSDNVFFDISNNNFSIINSAPDYSLGSDPATLSICPPTDAVYTINTGSVGGYSDLVMLSVSGEPAGSILDISPNPSTPGGSATLTIGNLAGVTAGDYTITVSASSTSGNKMIDIGLTVGEAAAAPALASPLDAATDISIVPTLQWSTIFNADEYEIQIATDNGFAHPVETAMPLTASYTLANELAPSSTYYWRVRSISTCGTSAWSGPFSFETVPCFIFNSTDVPKTISSMGVPTVTSTLEIPDLGTVTDVNVINLVGTHTWINDLTIDIISPGGAVVNLFDQICGNQDDFNIGFSDQANSSNYPCPPTDGNTYQSQESLSQLNTTTMQGTWTLRIKDNFNQDGGQLQSWGLRVCPSGFISPLPIEWLYFSVAAREKDIRLTWATGQEDNNAGFEIQRRSSDEATFIPIGWVDGLGTTSRGADYAWVDMEAKRGVRYYYRLRQVDFDGVDGYSPVKTAMLEARDGRCTMLWHASDHTILLGCPSLLSQASTLRIFNMQGQLMQFMKLTPGSQLTIETDRWVSGLYVFAIQTGDQYYAEKIAVVH